jgi:hypothetical protein
MKIQTLLISTFAIAVLHAQERDPFRENAATPPGGVEDSAPKNISICYETFSLPLALAAKIQREQLSDTDLYARILAAVEKQTARQETFTVLRLKSSNKASSESISEQIYPTEYREPQVPATVGVSVVPPAVKDEASPAPDAEKLRNAATLGSYDGVKIPSAPTAFETRNTGLTIEVEATIGESDPIMDLRIAAEHVALVGQTISGQGVAKAEMPVFENQSIKTSSTLHLNQPFLFGTVNRPPVSKADPDSANRVWFAFVTGTIAKP